MQRVRVLIADDNKAMCNKLVSLLEPRYDVLVTVGDGQALVDAALRYDPDIMLVDIEMPILNGIEAARRLRGSKGKIIFLTIHEDADFVDECLAAGGLGFIVKSHMASDLFPAIDAALNGQTFTSPSVRWID